MKKILLNTVEKTLETNKQKKIDEIKDVNSETIMPLDKEHLTKNKIRLNEKLMQKWCK